MINLAEAAVQPAEAAVQPAEAQPTTSEVINEPLKATTAEQVEQEPKKYLALIKKIEERTEVKCELEQVRVVIKAITDLVENPNTTLVMAVLCQIAEQGGFNMVGNHSDAILAGQARRAWEQVNEAQPTEKAEPNVTAQAEDETDMRASDAADSPVIGFRPIGTPEDKDKIGGSTTDPGERLD